MNPYQLPQLIAARNRVSTIRTQFQSGLGQAKTGGLVALGSYGAARLSAHLGGPGGAKVGGVNSGDVGYSTSARPQQNASNRWRRDCRAEPQRPSPHWVQ